MEQFHFISDSGKTRLPSKLELSELLKKQEELWFVLDSSVCMDIVNLIKWKKESKADKDRIFNLIEYAQKNRIGQISIFALLELCYNRQTLNIQQDKFLDFKRKIDFAFEYPIKNLKKYDYDFNGHNNSSPDIVENDLIKLLISERLNISYAGLLKICEISQKGIGSDFAERNIEEFLDWMAEELDVILGVEYYLALQIFGGNSKLRSMIKLDAAKERILKTAWGTAWDMFHAKMSCNRPQLSQLVGRNVYPIFVTKDANLFELISPQVIFYMRRELTKLSLTEQNSYPPFYSKAFMKHLNEKLFNLQANRIDAKHKRETNTDKIKLIITQLEDSLMH